MSNFQKSYRKENSTKNNAMPFTYYHPFNTSAPCISLSHSVFNVYTALPGKYKLALLTFLNNTHDNSNNIW